MHACNPLCHSVIRFYLCILFHVGFLGQLVSAGCLSLVNSPARVLFTLLFVSFMSKINDDDDDEKKEHNGLAVYLTGKTKENMDW